MNDRITSTEDLPFPTTLRIGVLKFEEEGQLGECDRHELTIKIKPDIPLTIFAEALKHEIIHACWSAAGLSPKEDEESVVTMLTPYLLMARRDNPELFAWIDSIIS